jgi:ADP-ribose pyrophosphatase YjhB (NUDIX family)
MFRSMCSLGGLFSSPVVWEAVSVSPRVRVTGVLIEGGRILLLRVRDPISPSSDRRWSLPGGKPEFGESIEACLKREMREETGLDVSVGKLLYVCDRILGSDHVVHMTFLVHRNSGHLVLGREPEPDANEILDVELVPIEDLESRGFTARFRELVEAGFPGAGSYKGLVRNIGL